MASKKKKQKRSLLQYNAPTTLTFTLLCLFVLFLDFITSGNSTAKLFCVYRWDMKEILGYVRLFTHVLGHSDFSHLTGNLVLMLVVGPALEERYGSGNMWWAIVVTALVSGMIQCLFFPGSALMGASGIVFMMIIMSSLGGMRGGIPITLILVFIIYIGGEVYTGIKTSDNISQITHIVGGICGAIMGIGMRVRGIR
ncbi:MAG: rhomboid family intramembrane serine protease [Oscillospiraceae bacterium]|nr:rhomboid family intramembrane serine protease [Oscillospiraceae bacterium]